MRRRRRYAELQDPQPASDAATAEPEPASPDGSRVTDAPLDPARANLLALQRGAGNMAAGRMLARDPATGAPVDLGIGGPGGGPGVGIQLEAQKRTEETMLRNDIVPALLTRMWKPPAVGPAESLAELTLMAVNELDAKLKQAPKLPGIPGFGPVASPVATIQQIVLDVARGKKAVVAGHRPPTDTAGLETEAQAMAALAGVSLPKQLKAAGSADGFKFTFDGELAASGKVGGADVSGRLGPDGAKVEGGAGPVKGSVSAGKDSIKVDLALKAAQVELKGAIDAKAGQPTKWSAALEIKIGGGADPVPDPAKISELVQKAEKHVVEGAQYVGSVIDDTSKFSKSQLEAHIKPIKEGVEAVAGVMKAKPSGGGGGPKVTLGVGASGSSEGGVSGTLNLTITFP